MAKHPSRFSDNLAGVALIVAAAIVLFLLGLTARAEPIDHGTPLPDNWTVCKEGDQMVYYPGTTCG